MQLRNNGGKKRKETAERFQLADGKAEIVNLSDLSANMPAKLGIVPLLYLQ
jgi:hypothetical protein